MDEVATVIAEQIDRGLCTGVQAASFAPTGMRCWANGTDGIGQPIGDDTLSAIYCASKPLLALAIHALESRGLISLDATAGAITSGRIGATDATVSDLLNHTAGVHISDGETLKLHGYARKQEIARRASPAPGWSPHDQSGYSEYVAWAILAQLVEAVTADRWTNVVEDLVLAPTGTIGELLPVVDASRYRETVGRIRINLDLRDRPTPLLNERGPTFACEPNPGYGAYGSAIGLARVIHLHLTDRNLRRPALTDEARRRGYRWDEVMHSRVDTQNGLLADLASYGVTGASANSVGHTGLMGLTTVIHEPDLQTTTAVTYFGLIDGPTATAVRRPQLLAAITRATRPPSPGSTTSSTTRTEA